MSHYILITNAGDTKRGGPKTYVRDVSRKNGVELTEDKEKAFVIQQDDRTSYVWGFANAICLLTGIPATPLLIK